MGVNLGKNLFKSLFASHCIVKMRNGKNNGVVSVGGHLGVPKCERARLGTHLAAILQEIAELGLRDEMIAPWIESPAEGVSL